MNYYKDANFSNKINDELNFKDGVIENTDNNFKYGSKYKITFKLENGNYVFVKSELVK